MNTIKRVGHCTLHVCISCRERGTPRVPKENRAGYLLYKQLCNAIEARSLQDRVQLKPAECLSVCPRPCGIALSSPGAWTYLFGDQQCTQTVEDIVDCVSIYLRTPNGYMARDDRPKALRSSILGRVPSIPMEEPCT